MKYDSCRTGFDLPSRGFTFTATWLLVLLCGLSAGANTAQAQTRAYVGNVCSGTVTVIDTATNTVIATIPVDGSYALAITPDGTRVYGASPGDNVVSVIDTATNSVIAVIPVASRPQGVAITPDGTRVYVANYDSNTVAVISTATNTIIATIPVFTNPTAVAITPDGARAYVTNFDNSAVTVIDTATNTVIATVPAGGLCPSAIAITPAPRVPRSKDECKNGGYRNFGPPAGPFRNQGQCVSYVESHSHR